jgi:adenosylcobinamide kinase/adenosylcobinamide-phosphate guanylyltransferase
MKIHLVTGGARGGKSRYAVELAGRIGGKDVTFVATANASDEEMARRITRHREERRASGWATIEAPVAAYRAVRSAETAVVLLDCLTLLSANTMASAYAEGEEAAICAMRDEAEQLVAAAGDRPGTLIVVTNEVGFGIHPETTAGRWFRDGLGIANQVVAAAADEVTLMVSGIPVTVKPS